MTDHTNPVPLDFPGYIPVETPPLPELPDWIPPALIPPVTRVSADTLPATPPRNTIAIAGEGSLIPEAYGRVFITRPRIFAIGYNGVTGFYWFGAVWCNGECDEIESIWQGDTIWRTGESSSRHQNYIGTPTQTVDPQLASFVAGYNDDMAGLCYSSIGFHYKTPIKISTLGAIVKAKKIYDPRTTFTVYSDNFALMFADLAVNQGLSTQDANIIIAADYNDEDLGGGHRRRWGGLLFQRQLTVDKQLKLIAEHAGCIYFREAGVAKLIPDAPADSVAIFNDSPGIANIVEGSVKLAKISLDNLPNHSIVEYLDSGATPWRTGYAETPLPSGEVRSTNFRMRGFQSFAVAFRHAIERQNRFNLTDLSIQFETFDEGLEVEQGDVITVTHNIGLVGKLFRVSKVKASKFVGSWIISAEEYDPAVYSDSIQTEPTWPDINLPEPEPVPIPGEPVLTYEYRVNDEDVIEMWVFIEWAPFLGAYPYEHIFELQLFGINEDMFLIVLGSTIPSEILLGPVVPGALHRLNMWTVNFAGIYSIGRIVYFTADDNAFAPDNVLGFHARSVGNMLRCCWDALIGVHGIRLGGVRYELRFGASGVIWEDADLIDSVFALEFTTRNLLPGTYDILLKAIVGGQESTDAAIVTNVIITDNPDGFIVSEVFADHASSISMTLTNRGTEWVTDSGEHWNTLFVSAMETYDQPLYSYQTVGPAEYISEELDTAGADFVGVWRVEASARLLNGDLVPFTEQVAEIWDGSWNNVGDVVAVFNGTKVRYRVNTTGKVFIVRLTTVLSVDIVPYVIRGTSTSSAVAADQITWSPIPDFIGFYSASIAVSAAGGGFIGTYDFDPSAPFTFVDFYVWDTDNNQVAEEYSYEIRGA